MGRKLLLGLLLLAPLGLYPFLSATLPPKLVVPPASSPLAEEHRAAFLSFAATPGQTFPACIPWESMRRIGECQSTEMEDLVKKDPVKFLEVCLARYEKEVQGYRCVFHKHERVNDKLRDPEVILVHFREKPFSVHMNWQKGEDLCIRSMYVAGQYEGKLVARPLFFGRELPVLARRPLDAPDVMSTTRFGIDKFGMYLGAKATLDAIHAAQKAGTLHLKYEGIETVAKAGNRRCYKLVRTPYMPPEEKEGINELTIYIDRATLFQVGSILKDARGEFIAEYFFTEIELNPIFDEKQFTDKAL